MSLYSRRFPLKLKLAVYKNYVRLAILCGSEAWCLKESKMGISRTERSMMRAMCRVQLKDRKRSKDFMLMLGLNETRDHLAMTNSGRWYGHVFRRDDGHLLRRALDFVVEGQRKKRRSKRTWKRQVEEEHVKDGIGREDAIGQSKWIVGVNLIATILW